MPDLARSSRDLHWVKENAKWDGVRVRGARQGLDYAGCVTLAQPGLSMSAYGKGRKHHPVPIRYEVILDDAHPPTVQLATLAHGLGHLYCGHIGTHDKDLWSGRPSVDARTKELEAESVARVVLSRRFPGAKLPDHLMQFFDGEPELTGLDLERVLTAAGRVLESADGYRPRRANVKSKTTLPTA